MSHVCVCRISVYLVSMIGFAFRHFNSSSKLACYFCYLEVGSEEDSNDVVRAPFPRDIDWCTIRNAEGERLVDRSRTLFQFHRLFTSALHLLVGLKKRKKGSEKGRYVKSGLSVGTTPSEVSESLAAFHWKVKEEN